MKFSQEIIINQPRDRVVELFDSQENLKEWQEGLQTYEHLSGTPGQPGARAKLTYDMGGRVVEMVETITVNSLPEEFSGTYEAKGVWNEVKNYFHEDGPERTRWVSENEFRFTGFMKLLGFFMRGSFPKQSYQIMGSFKAFAERSG